MKIKWLCLVLMLIHTFTFATIRPVPWLVEESIEFLEKYLEENPNARVLEFGSGASTIWLSDRVAELHSVEHDDAWHNEIQKLLPTKERRALVFLYKLDQPYYTVCEQFENESFDLILVDGRNRKGCIEQSLPLLKQNGVLMLDNSERSYYFPIYHLMSSWPSRSFIQTRPDSCGFFYPGWETKVWIKP